MGPNGPPIPAPTEFSVVPYPNKRELLNQNSKHFEFIATGIGTGLTKLCSLDGPEWSVFSVRSVVQIFQYGFFWSGLWSGCGPDQGNSDRKIRIMDRTEKIRTKKSGPRNLSRPVRIFCTETEWWAPFVKPIKDDPNLAEEDKVDLNENENELIAEEKQEKPESAKSKGKGKDKGRGRSAAKSSKTKSKTPTEEEPKKVLRLGKYR